MMTAAGAFATGPLRTPLPTTLPTGPVAAPAFPNASSRLPSIPGVKAFRRADIDGAALASRARLHRAGPFALDLGSGLHWELDLQRVSARAPGYRVHVLRADGVHDIAPGEELSFRGRLNGDPESRVRLSFAGDRVTGFIEARGERTYIEPLDRVDPAWPAGAHAVYRHSDLAFPANGMPLCGFRPETAPAAPGLLLPPVPAQPLPRPSLGPGPTAPTGLAKGAAVSEPCALVEIGVAAAYSMVKGYGSAAAVEKRITDIFNQVEGLYEDPRININIQITEMFIEETDKQTWGGTMDINAYLAALPAWARGATGFKNAYDVADLWYYDPLVATSTTGLANVGTVCNKTSGGHVIRDFTRTASYLVINQAHELGHNFGANHVNDATSILNPMILGDNLAWDDTTINAILNHKHTRTCLSSCNKGPTADFAIVSPSPCADTRQFQDASKGDPTAWAWDFGDGKTSTLENPTHTYAAAGTYTAKLTASNAAGTNSISKGAIKVKPFAAPAAQGARACGTASVTLTASGSATLKWYDKAAGGTKVGEGASFTTPALTETRIYYVENGDPDPAVQKLGPAANTIGAGGYFTANSDRRMYFDVNRPALLKTAKVYAQTAGPRTVEILDQGDARVAARTVQVPAGESRITLDIELEPGHDYALKYAGSPDSLNLFRNSAGAVYPYRTKDSLIVITHSDAVTSDSTSQKGYYYFFYDMEVQERGCGSGRVPVTAEISCVPILPAGLARALELRPLGQGRWRLDGEASAEQRLEVRLRRLDGSEVRRDEALVRPGIFALDIDLAGLPANLYLLEVSRNGTGVLRRLIGS
jgi:PKD repeat protein